MLALNNIVFYISHLNRYMNARIHFHTSYVWNKREYLKEDYLLKED